MQRKDELLARLVTMHAYCRPRGSKTERAFRDRWIMSLGAEEDQHGNLHVVRGDVPVLWSCHTDTAHKRDGSQKVRLNSKGILTTRNGSCLGADDTAGVFLLTEMIRRDVPGHYVFHYGEECGCIGSRKLAAECPTWLENIQWAIALDRRGYGDVITHQVGLRTASDPFAVDLAERLNALGMDYEPSDRGLYTDTESYADIVPECTNLSIGYSGEHGPAESLDTAHVLQLLEALSSLDVSALPVSREPGSNVYYVDDYRLDDRTYPNRDGWDDRVYLDRDVAEIVRQYYRDKRYQVH